MEDTHGAAFKNSKVVLTLCLNPYYNGRYSWRVSAPIQIIKYEAVLILIIMEDTHGVPGKENFIKELHLVLILIIMEDTHGGNEKSFYL